MMDNDLRRHLSDMLAKMQPLLSMADRDGVPGLAAARLRAAALEIEEALDPGAIERRSAEDRARDREMLQTLRRQEQEKGVWGLDEA